VFDESKVQGRMAPNIRGILIFKKSGRGIKKGLLRPENRGFIRIEKENYEF
jgi:hypothetical protein